MLTGFLSLEMYHFANLNKVLFYVFSAIIVFASLMTVLSRRILRAAIFLLFVLIATAGIYFMLGYYFLAAVQISIYVGGIVVLIIFSILLTHNLSHRFSPAPVIRQAGASFMALCGVILVVSVIRSYPFQTQQTTSAGAGVKDIGHALLSTGAQGYALPFEFISVLLLAAMVGAIIIAKKN